MTPAERAFEAARSGDTTALAAVLDEHPDALHARADPYEQSLLHAAAQRGHRDAVDLLLRRGLDANTRERGDNSYAMHWAAAAGRLDIVRRLADAGGDVVGAGDDHQLEVIGWASCWDECRDDAHRAVVEFLLSRGAKHHIFSAVAMNLGDEVRRIVAADPSTLNRRQSRNENHRTPLHFAVVQERPEMVKLLLELGADPLAVDGFGQTAAAYSGGSDADRPVLEKLATMVDAEFESASRGNRAPRGTPIDLVALLALGRSDSAGKLLHHNPSLLEPTGGVLHLMAQRGDTAAAMWLLSRGADVNGRWVDGDVAVAPLHLAIMRAHATMVRLLLDAGADPTLRDSKFDADAIGWAEHFQLPELVRILREYRPRP